MEGEEEGAGDDCFHFSSADLVDFFEEEADVGGEVVGGGVAAHIEYYFLGGEGRVVDEAFGLAHLEGRDDDYKWLELAAENNGM